MKQRIICKTLAVAVILLFLGLDIQPSVAVQRETEIDIEPKDYLFQTIIDIANNPDVKDLYEQYEPDMFNIDIDRGVYRKLLLRNPRLIFNTLLSKPSVSVEYLNEFYNKGIEVIITLGEDIVFEIIENIEITDTKLLDNLNNIISKDKELSERLATLNGLNFDICGIGFILLGTFFILTLIFGSFVAIPDKILDSISNPILEAILLLVYLPIYLPLLIIYDLTVLPIGIISIILIIKYDCINWYPY